MHEPGRGAEYVPNGSAPWHDDPPPPQGTLVLHFSRQCCYTEGALFFLEVRNEAGDPVLHRTWIDATFRFRASLPAGRYTVLTYERLCPGACPPPGQEGPLDPPTSRCERAVVIEAGGRYRLDVITGPRVVAPCEDQG